MIFTEMNLQGAIVVDLEEIADERGFFARAFSKEEFESAGLMASFVEANLSYSRRRGTIRGLHYQQPPYAEDKLFRCIRGSLLDVVVDVRPESSTFKQWTSVELSARNRRMMYVPKGCANGYQALEDDTEALYWVTHVYAPEAERGIRWNDPAFDISWPEALDVILSHKDRSWPDFEG